MTKMEWPEWPLIDGDKLRDMTRMVTPFVKFLHPDIVAGVVDDNAKQFPKWAEILRTYKCDPGLYLWDRSSCAFPGVRRHEGGDEKKDFRKSKKKFPRSVEVDDNSYPKHIWSFVFRGKSESKKGPDGYALAHLATHKNSRGMIKEFKKIFNVPHDDLVPHGLFTCLANTVFMPTSCIRLTDFCGETRTLLLHKAQSLYPMCNLVPPGISLRPLPSAQWAVESFDWSPPVGEVGLLDKFFEFRNEWYAGLASMRDASEQ